MTPKSWRIDWFDRGARRPSTGQDVIAFNGTFEGPGFSHVRSPSDASGWLERRNGPSRAGSSSGNPGPGAKERELANLRDFTGRLRRPWCPGRGPCPADTAVAGRSGRPRHLTGTADRGDLSPGDKPAKRRIRWCGNRADMACEPIRAPRSPRGRWWFVPGDGPITHDFGGGARSDRISAGETRSAPGVQAGRNFAGEGSISQASARRQTPACRNG